MRSRVLLFLLVVLVTASIGVRERRIEKAFAGASTADRVDMGVTLIVVRKDPVHGEELIPDLPRMTQVGDPISLGGMVSLRGRTAEYDGPSESPRIWYASQQQADLILHGDDRPIWSLVEGSEGSNKTATLVRWLAVRVLENVGRSVEIGLTGPNGPRMQTIKEEIDKWWSPEWWTFSERYQLYRFRAGPRIRLVSAHQRSKQAGSSIQSFNWVACASDEFQDHSEREADIVARGRTAPRGRYYRLCTSTPKDATAWRDFRSACKAPPKNGLAARWSYTKMLGKESPFVPDAHWENFLAGGITDREIRRRVDAEDVGPERQVYHCFARTERNGDSASLRPVPPGAVDITAQVLRRWADQGQSIGLLVGHDPGKRQHVSVFLKAYLLPAQPLSDQRPRWFVVDEVTTPESTILTHVDAVQRRVRERWGCNLLEARTGKPSTECPIALVRVDPHTRSGTTHPGQDVYLTWRQQGFLTRAAFYKPNSVEPAVIKVEERINVVNTLLEARTGEGPTERRIRRLFVAVNEDGRAAAPMLVKAFETMERNAGGEAEAEAKDEHDLSHWPAATGYALYLVEHGNVGVPQPRKEAA